MNIGNMLRDVVNSASAPSLRRQAEGIEGALDAATAAMAGAGTVKTNLGM